MADAEAVRRRCDWQQDVPSDPSWRQWHASPPPSIGRGVVCALPEIIGSTGATKVPAASVALVHGGNLEHRAGGASVARALRGFDYATCVHRGIPTPVSVAELAAALRDGGIQVVIAVGGGAVIDAAKAAAVLCRQEVLDSAAVVAACGQRQDGPAGALVVAVVTTAGTGAEVTPFATIWDVASGRKLSLAGSALLPHACVLDPDLLAGLPLIVLASGVLDTIAQGAEAAWSARATRSSTRLGLRAVQGAGARLGRVAANRLEPDDLGALQLAAHLSGRAIAIANTTACHAVSYPLTLRYGLAHGHACGAALGRLVDFNAGVTPSACTDPRGSARVRDTVHRVAAGIGVVPGRVARRLDGFLDDIGLERLSDLDLDYELVAEEACSYPRCHDNPVRLDGRLADVLSAPVEAGVACG